MDPGVNEAINYEWDLRIAGLADGFVDEAEFVYGCWGEDEGVGVREAHAAV